MKLKISPIQLARRISLGFFLGLTSVLAFLHQSVASIPNVDAMCPFGGLETAYKLFAGGEFIKKVGPSNIALLALIIVLGILLARFFCGWICAFGALQGVFGAIGRKLFKRQFTVPQKLDRVLRYIKYPLLAGILYLTWKTGELIIRPYDPWAAYAHLSAGPAELFSEFAIGAIILFVTLVLSVIYERAFCKYLCPLGAFNALLSRIPLFRVKREASTCISCSKCDRVCPMNVQVMASGTVNDSECISCMECVTACPTGKKTLGAFFAGKRVLILAVAIIAVLLYIGTMFVGKVTGTIRYTEPTLTELAKQGALKIEDIKGSTTWGELASSWKVDLNALLAAAGVDPAVVPPETRLKDTAAVAGIPDFEPDTARFAIAGMLGIEYAGENEVDSDHEATASAAPVASQSPAPAVPAVEAAPAVTALRAPAGFLLEGTMTVRDVAAALGWTENQVLEKLSLSADLPRDRPLRELKDSYGFNMAALKTRILE